MSVKERIVFFLLCILAVLDALTIHPVIVQMGLAAGLKQGSILTPFFIAGFVAAFVISLIKSSFLQSRYIKKSVVTLFFIALTYGIVFALFDNSYLEGDLRAIGICVVAAIIGYESRLTENNYSVLLLVFATSVTFVGLMQVLTNIGGFIIESVYLVNSKNTLGVFLANAAIIYFYFALRSKKFKVLFLAAAFFVLFLILTARCRAAFVATVLVLLYLTREYYKNINLFLLILFTIPVIALLLTNDIISDYVYNSFYSGYEGGDVTSGRSARNEETFGFVMDNLLTGNLILKSDMEQVHNFILCKLFQTGILFSIPVLYHYFFTILFSFKAIRKQDIKIVQNLGLILLMVPFIISLAEYTLPYGPGTATVFNFIFFGVALRNIPSLKHSITI